MTKKQLENGVIISTREMYGVLQDIKSQVNVIQSEVRNINKTDERSRQALELANDAMQKALDLEKEIEKMEKNQQWLQGLFLTAFLGVAGFLLSLTK